MLYNEVVRCSHYVPGFGGTKIAVIIYRPAINNQPVSTPYPTVLIQTQYHRSAKSFNETGLENLGVNTFVKHGYVVLIIDGRGTGASFGARTEGFPPEHILDAKALLEWTAAQAWCNGRIGMMGGSYMGQAQYMFATTRNPHLPTITPAAAPINAYDHHYVGGVWEDVTWFSNMVRGLDFKAPVRPVDDDPAPSYPLMTKAREEHKGNIYSDQMLSPDMFRDSWCDLVQFRPSITLSPITYADKIKASGVSVYVIGGWYDIFLRDSLGPWSDLGVPFHRNYQENYAPLPKGKPVELVFDIYATSYVFRKGNSIRATITCSHLHTYKTPENLKFDPTPVVSIYRDADHPSFITLPVIPYM